MDHLREIFLSYDSSIQIDCVTDQDQFTSDTFTFEDFHAYPDRRGWTVDNHGAVSRKTNLTPSLLAQFLQEWLFFGLLFAIVRDDGRLLITFEDLVPDSRSSQPRICTRSLPKALDQWAKYEVSHRRAPGTQSRMVNIRRALNKAKKVVRIHCAEDGVLRQPLSNNFDFVSDELAISLMVLGETISATQESIMDCCASDLSRPVAFWDPCASPGWGPPAYVTRQMTINEWCPKFLRYMKLRLGRRSISFLSVYLAKRDSPQYKGRQHSKCSQEECFVKSGCKGHDDYAQIYETAHYDGCQDEEKVLCERIGLIGPSNMEDVHRILDRPEKSMDSSTPRFLFPLAQLVYNNETGNVKAIRIVQGDDKTLYTVISHVWSDGYGNEEKNELRQCQLNLIGKLLLRITKKRNALFWMDTLVVPVGKEDFVKELRAKAIRQIQVVFSRAQYTVVLDRSLLRISSGGEKDPCLTAAQLIGSGWMSRLWTLQEAFKSKEMKLAFGPLHNIEVRDVDELREALRKTSSQPLSYILARPLMEELCESIMWKDRENWKQAQKGAEAYAEDRPGRLSAVISNAWRAARWRTTSNPAHEPVALLTMLELLPHEELARAGALRLKDEKANKALKLDRLMKYLWLAIDEDSKGAIPAGICFLPGQKVLECGFGWAPKTFMKPVELEYPDPLTTLVATTSDLRPQGLVISCPGFLVHADNTHHRSNFFNYIRDGYSFPVDEDSWEWYCVKGPKTSPHVPIGDIVLRNTELAVVVCCQGIGENPHDIGMLVELWDPSPLPPRERDIKFARIISLVTVQRVNPSAVMRTQYEQTRSGSSYVDARKRCQRWCIDGFQVNLPTERRERRNLLRFFTGQ